MENKSGDNPKQEELPMKDWKEESEYSIEAILNEDNWISIKVSLIVNYFSTIISPLQQQLSSLKSELLEYRKDLEDAAGELMIKIPEPGSVLSKMLAANSILRQKVSQLESENSKLIAANELAVEEITRLENERDRLKILIEKMWNYEVETGYDHLFDKDTLKYYWNEFKKKYYL